MIIHLIKADLSQNLEAINIDKCLQIIIEKIVPENVLYTAVIAENNYGVNFLRQSKTTKILIQTYSNLKQFKQLYRFDVYIFMLKNSTVNHVLNYFYPLQSWNPRAKFMILSELEEPQKIIEEVVEFYITNIIVLKIEDNNLKIFSLDLNEWFKKNLKLSLTDTCFDGSLEKNAILFSDNSQINLWKKWTLRVLLMPIAPYVFFNERTKSPDGMEILGLDIIKEKMGFNVEYLRHDFRNWGYKLNTGNYTGMFGMLQYFQADVVLGMCPANYTWNWDFDATFPYMADTLVWMVPKAELLPHWTKLIHIYPLLLWINLLIFLIALPILWFAVATLLKNEEPTFKIWDKNQVRTFSMILGISLPHLPKTNTVRLLFTSWLLPSLIFLTIYQSKLIAVLNNPQYERQITTNQEILDSGIEFGFNINLKSIFSNKYKMEKEFLDRGVICDLSLACPNRTAFKKDFATTKSSLAANYMRLKYYTASDGTSLVHIFKSSLFFHFVHVVFARGHPIFNRFNEIIIRLWEHGLTKYWREKTESETLKSSIQGEEISLVLSLKHMTPAFQFLFVGLFVALIFLVVENICNKICSNTTMSNPFVP